MRARSLAQIVGRERQRGPRTLTLTDAGRAAIGKPSNAKIPLLRLPWRPDWKDRRDDRT